MDVTEQLQVPPAPPAEPAAPGFPHCDECGAAVEATQRYCVNCGAHRRGVNDPAARYLSEASARTRRSPGTSGSRPRPRAWRGPEGWAAAVAIALVPIAAGVGVAVGRSSNNQDPRLIQALEHQRSRVVTTAAATPAGSTGAATSPSKSQRHTRAGAHRASSHAKATATSTTKYGTAGAIAGTKVTAAQAAQGAAAAQSVQKSTGSSYVQSANKLPSTVVVP